MPARTHVVARRIRLKEFAPDDVAGLEKRPTKKRTAKLAARIGELQKLFFANRTRALLLVFQGMDASGKDGAIRKVLRDVAPTGLAVTNFRRPSEEESAHDFLWRVHRAVPRFGTFGVFNRSHYEAVLVERVELGVPAKTCAQRHAQIVEFERMLAQNGVVILKFFLHLSRREQAKRLKARRDDPHKRWKYRPEDRATRRHWDAYQAAYEEMLNATSHPAARWHLVPADKKWFRDYVIAKAVAQALARLQLTWPQGGK